jgi:pimeloyl-ACP methyl ester carboxylesterase
MLRRVPEFVAGLAIIDSRAGVDSQEVRRARYEMVERARHEGTGFLETSDPPLSPRTKEDRPDVVAAVRKIMADATPVGVMVAQRAMAARKDERQQLESTRIPVTVVYGEDDPIVPRAEAEAMAAAIPGATFVIVPNAGHLPPIEQPDAVTAALRDLAHRAFPA